jgi:hypothetical protein
MDSIFGGFRVNQLRLTQKIKCLAESYPILAGSTRQEKEDAAGHLQQGQKSDATKMQRGVCF